MAVKRRAILRGFTLLEMLVTLTIFALVSAVIYNLLGTGLRILDREGGRSQSGLQAELFVRYLDNLLRDSWKLDQDTNGFLEIRTHGGLSVSVISNRGQVLATERGPGGKVRTRAFRLDKLKKLDWRAVSYEGRYALKLDMDTGIRRFDRYFLLGYRKERDNDSLSNGQADQ